MPEHSRALSVVADLGGTNTRVALARGGQLMPETIRRYRNADHPSLEAILRLYLETMGAECEGACVAVAGPVQNGAAQMTNLDWQMDHASIAEATGAKNVALLNDLQAQGHALGHLAPEMMTAVLPGAVAPAGAPRLVIGVGTGFNAAPVHEMAGGRLVAPSECGHITLPVRTATELRLAHHIEEQHGFAAVEEVLSGRGLEGLHAWLNEEQEPLGAAAIMARISAGDPMAMETGKLFTALLGRVAGDLALVHLPFGGIYLIGGVARAFGPWLSPFGFDHAFYDKGRFSNFLKSFPVWLVEDDYAALAGCAGHISR